MRDHPEVTFGCFRRPLDVRKDWAQHDHKHEKEEYWKCLLKILPLNLKSNFLRWKSKLVNSNSVVFYSNSWWVTNNAYKCANHFGNCNAMNRLVQMCHMLLGRSELIWATWSNMWVTYKTHKDMHFYVPCLACFKGITVAQVCDWYLILTMGNNKRLLIYKHINDLSHFYPFYVYYMDSTKLGETIFTFWLNIPSVWKLDFLVADGNGYVDNWLVHCFALANKLSRTHWWDCFSLQDTERHRFVIAQSYPLQSIVSFLLLARCDVKPCALWKPLEKENMMTKKYSL